MTSSPVEVDSRDHHQQTVPFVPAFQAGSFMYKRFAQLT